MGSLGDSQPIDTHVPPVCPFSHLDREDGGSMFLQIKLVTNSPLPHDAGTPKTGST